MEADDDKQVLRSGLQGLGNSLILLEEKDPLQGADRKETGNSMSHLRWPGPASYCASRTEAPEGKWLAQGQILERIICFLSVSTSSPRRWP